MRTEVRYFTKNGGTKKLGSSVYGGKPAPEVVKFIQANAKNIGKIVVFGSACTGKSTFPAIKSAAAGCAVKTAEMFFQCKGQWLFFNKNRPNDQDCSDAADFARKQIKILGQT